jgi:hypothetical protein
MAAGRARRITAIAIAGLDMDWVVGFVAADTPRRGLQALLGGGEAKSDHGARLALAATRGGISPSVRAPSWNGGPRCRGELVRLGTEEVVACGGVEAGPRRPCGSTGGGGRDTCAAAGRPAGTQGAGVFSSEKNEKKKV